MTSSSDEDGRRQRVRVLLRKDNSSQAEEAAARAEIERLQREVETARQALVELEARYRAIADFTYDWEYWLGPDGRFIYVSPSCERITGYPPEAFLEDPELLDRIVHPDDRQKVEDHVRQLSSAGEALPIDFRIIDRSGQEHWVSHVCQAIYDTDGKALGRRASNRDITERKRTEEALRESWRILDALMEYVPEGIAIADAPDVRIHMMSKYGRELTGRSREVIEGIPADQLAKNWGIFYADGMTPATNDVLPLTRAVKHGEIVQDEEWVLRQPSGEMIPVLCSAGPICSGDGCIVGGVLAFRDMRAIKATHRSLEEAFLREQHISQTLQHALMPDEFSRELPGFEIVGRYRAAFEEAEVGGDFYDVFDLADGRTALVMGDVSGKGLQAAAFTAMAKYILRAYAHENPDPSFVMERLNDALCEYTPEALFITFFYGVLDPAAGILTYANAGHNEPLHYDQKLGCVLPLDITGRAAGIVLGSSYGQRTLTLAPGDVLLIYTDGITNARSGSRFFGTDGLTRVLVENVKADGRGIADAIFEAASEAAAGRRSPYCRRQYGDPLLRDDAAVLILQARTDGNDADQDE